MKKNSGIIAGFKAVEFMRRERDQISNEIKDMNFVELKRYFEERRNRLTGKTFQTSKLSKIAVNEIIE